MLITIPYSIAFSKYGIILEPAPKIDSFLEQVHNTLVLCRFCTQDIDFFYVISMPFGFTSFFINVLAYSDSNSYLVFGLRLGA